MFKFQPYPITVSGSQIDELVRRFAEEGHRAGMFDINRKLRLLRDANRFDYVNDPSPAARQYESRVRALLSAIARSAAGRRLFDSMKNGLPIWIVRYDSAQRRNPMLGRCNSNAGHAVAAYLNNQPAVRIAFSPELWSFSDCGGYPGMRADEVLFHELVHAYRYANVAAINNDPLPDHLDFEEFLAHQLTSVYRSTKGAKRFNRDHISKVLGSAEECEMLLWSRQVLLDAIDWFLRYDPMVQAMSGINTRYNPFLRIDELKELRRKSHPGSIHDSVDPRQGYDQRSGR